MKTMPLSEWIARKKMTQTAFAASAGLDAGVVSRAIGGERWPDFKTIAAILKATGGAVTAHEIFLVCQRRRTRG